MLKNARTDNNTLRPEDRIWWQISNRNHEKVASRSARRVFFLNEMTLVIALKWLQEEGEGVLISSDSRATYGPIAYEVKKIHPIFYSHDEEEIDLWGDVATRQYAPNVGL